MMTTDMKIKLGQRLAVGFDGYEIPQEYIDLVREHKIGNAILFRRNCRDYGQLKGLCADLRALITEETGYEPFIMIDEECGSVSRLAPIAGETPCAMAIGATDEPENAYRIGKIMGERLRAVGVNFNLAPVLDCYTNPNNTASGNRCFAREPEKVAAFGAEYIRGMQEAGVLACGKHFPGHGDTAVDSHLALPIVDKPMEEVRRTELVSFEAAIRGSVSAIMSAHVVFPAMEPERVPSTVSRRVMTGLLREALGFEGIIVSDGMEMQAVMDLFGIEEGTRRALAAGVDVALVCHSPGQAASTSRYLLAAAADGRLDAGEIDEHFARITARKARLMPPSGDERQFRGEAQDAAAREIMEKAVRLVEAPDGSPLPKIGADTLFLGAQAKAASLANDVIELDAAAVCARAFGGVYGGPAPDTALLDRAKTAVVFMGRGADRSAQVEAARRLVAAGAKVIAVSLYTPRCLDDMPGGVWKICAWQYERLALDALIAFLKRS